MLSAQQKELLYIDLHRIGAYANACVNFVMGDSDQPKTLLPPPITEEELSGFNQQIDLKMAELTKQVVDLSNNTIPYDLSEKIIYTYMKTTSEISVKNYTAFHALSWQKRQENDEDFFDDIEFKIMAISQKTETAARKRLIEEAANNGFNKIQAETVILAMDKMSPEF